MRDIEAIIFDVGEVQVQGLVGVNKHLEPVVGKPIDGKALFESTALAAYFRGACDEDELWREWSKDFGWSAQIDDLKTAVRKNFTEVPGTRRIIELLNARRYPLGLLSVHGREWVRHIASRFSLHTPFRHVSYSYCGGPSKPDPRAFEACAEKLRVEPRFCLVIDDYPVNTEAAARAGFQTHLFTDAHRLHNELRTHDVLVDVAD